MVAALQTKNAEFSQWFAWELPVHQSSSVSRGPQNVHQLAQKNFAPKREVEEQCVPSEFYSMSHVLFMYVTSVTQISKFLQLISTNFSLPLALDLMRSQAAPGPVSWPTVMPATMMRSPAPVQNTAQSVRIFRTIWQTLDVSVAGPTAWRGIKEYLAARY